MNCGPRGIMIIKSRMCANWMMAKMKSISFSLKGVGVVVEIALAFF